MTSLPPDHPFAGPDAPDRLAAALNALAAEPSAGRLALLRLAATEVRRAIDELVTTDAPDADVAEATALLAQAVELLARGPHGRPYEGTAEGSLGGDSRTFVDFSPLVGPANPLAPPLTVEVADGSVIGRGVFGDAYEGPPGCLHGGYIAAVFDEVLGFAQSLTGRPGMTGRLTVHYRSPTPLHVELLVTGRVARVDGRKIHTTAELHAGGRLCADAEALFISVDPSIFERMLAERGG